MSSPINFRHVQKAIRDEVIRAVGSDVEAVIWSMPNIPRPTRPYIALDFVSEVERPDFGDELQYTLSGEEGLITVDNAVEDKYYQIAINGILVEYLSQPGDTLTLIRDALLELLESVFPDLTFTPIGVNQISVIPIEIGLLHNIQTNPEFNIYAEILGEKFIANTIGERYYTLSIDTFSEKTLMHEGAWNLAEKIRMHFEKETTSDRLWYNQIALLEKPGSIRDLSAVFGSQFESRCQFEILITTAAFSAEEAQYIETVEFEFSKDE